MIQFQITNKKRTINQPHVHTDIQDGGDNVQIKWQGNAKAAAILTMSLHLKLNCGDF
jgi:hypothetical protein